jgi:uncharacterized protein YecA (UPF0149 family)
VPGTSKGITIMRVYVPKPGHVLNPMTKYPVNSPCPCGSGKKWKKCHRQITNLHIPVDQAPALEVAMKHVLKK